ncbi:MAG: NADH-quinone oxidoreductase subunit J [Gammaproteobacteria bacterium]|nr:NADH-quinone oxidoreductase subunit J [Gammaproteobacteria bacterium]NNJ49462.1 NADH-quinone oxidoreductase subunit J [Gammaproteobacteria bacterium]
MMITDFLFFAFAGVVIASALGVVASRNPVHSALFLVLTFFSCSAIWLMLEAEFLAITLVLVYVGAVMVLFLFVVMMLDINVAKMREGFVSYLPVGIVFAVLMLAVMVYVVGPVGPDVMGTAALDNAVRQAADYSNTEALGEVLYTDYVLAFEIAAVILLVAIIAAITLTLRRRPTTKYQTPGKQIKVKRDDRLKVIKSDAEVLK